MVYRTGEFCVACCFVIDIRHELQIFTHHLCVLQAMEQEMEAAMEGMQWPGADGSAPTGGDENPECKQS